MSDGQRQRAFAISAAVLAAVLVLVWLVERPHAGHATTTATRAARPTRPVVLGGSEAPEASIGESPTREASEGDPAHEIPAREPTREAPAWEAPGEEPPPSDRTVPGQARIEATARRFTAAFVQYEVGRLPTAVRRGIQATATPSFASSLLLAPPRIPDGMAPPAPARILSAALANGPVRGQAAVVVEMRSEGGEVSALTELLKRKGREWLVSGLG
jgi:hypothetical protein